MFYHAVIEIRLILLNEIERDKLIASLSKKVFPCMWETAAQKMN